MTRPPTLFPTAALWAAALTLLELSLPQSAMASKSAQPLLLAPDQVRNDQGQTLATVWHLEEHALYAFRPGTRGVKITGHAAGHIDRVVLSPRGNLIAYAFRDHYPHDQQEVWALHPRSVIVTDRNGVHLDSIGNSATFAWSPSGASLAAIAPTHYESGVRPTVDTLIVWNAASRSRKVMVIPLAGDELHWAGEDSLIAGSAVIVPATGRSLPGVERDLAQRSPDQRFALSGAPETAQFSLIDRKYGTNVGWLFLHAVGRKSLQGAGPMAWVPGARSGHLLAFTTWDSVPAPSGGRRPSHVTHWVDASSMRVLRRIPGLLVGVSGDKTVVFDENGLRFEPAPGPAVSEDRYAPKGGPPGGPVALQIRSESGGKGVGGYDGIKRKTEVRLVQPGEWITWWADDPVFRILRTMPSGEVLAETGPEWGVLGTSGAGTRALVLLSETPLPVVRFNIIDASYIMNISVVGTTER